MAWVGWLAMANTLLFTGAAADFANQRPERFTIDYRRGWSVVPLVVHLDGVRLSGQARYRAWSATVDQATLALALPTLLLRRIDLPWLSARGAAVEVHTVPIEMPPRFGAPHWRIAIGPGRVADLRRFRWKQVLFEGPGAAAKGRVRWTTRGDFEAPSLSVTGGQGRLFVADEVAAQLLELHLDMRADAFPTPGADLERVVRASSGRLRVRAEGATLGFLQRLLGGWPWLTVTGRDAKVEADLRVAAGSLTAGSTLSASAARVEVGLLRWLVRAPLAVALEVDEPGHQKIRAEAPQFDISRPDRPPFAAGDGLELTAELTEGQLLRRHPPGLATLRLGEATVADVTLLGDLLPNRSELAVERGSASLEAELAVDSRSRTARGRIRLRGDDISATYRDRRFSTALDIDLRLDAGEQDFASDRLELAGSRLVIGPAGLVTPDGDTVTRDWFLNGSVATGQLTLADQPRLVASIELEATNPRPVLGFLLSSDQGVDRAMRWFSLGPLVGTAQLEIGSDEIAVTGLDASSGEARLEAELCLTQPPHALIRARYGDLQIGRESYGPQGSDWKVLGVDEWFDRHRAAFSCP